MPRPPADHRTLDRSAVVRAAAELVNAAGIDALTINRLARQLNVQPPSLYNHISGLPGLWRELALLNAQNLCDRLTTAAIGKSGPEGVRALAKAYRAYIIEFPGLYQASLRASGTLPEPDPQLSAAEDRVVRVALAVVESFRLSGADAIHAVRALRSVIHGFATLEVAGGFGLPLDLDESFNRLIEMCILGMEKREDGNLFTWRMDQTAARTPAPDPTRAGRGRPLLDGDSEKDRGG
jgi:AcrR family transcriptional regulator